MTDKEIRDMLRELSLDIKSYIKETVKPIVNDLEYMEKRIFKGNGGKPLSIQISENKARIDNLDEAVNRIESSVIRLESKIDGLIGEVQTNSNFRINTLKVTNKIIAGLATLALMGGIYFALIYKGGLL